MTKNIKENVNETKQPKRCPLCGKEYPENDGYCGDDGTLLEQAQSAAAQAVPAGR
ncbi:MAG TPA: hypothetical protein VEZ90_16615 [Blastocatellia bacterium]|nr:hypothetical protein [Blastocatellia bacterium]